MTLGSKIRGLLGKPTEKDDLADDASSWLTETWTILKSSFIIFHQNIWEALLFYVGQTRIRWDKSRSTFYPDESKDDWVPQPRLNRFSPTVDSIATNFNAIPEIEAVPNNTLNGDLKIHGIAEIASAIGKHAFRINGLYGTFKNNADRAGYAAQLFVLAGSVFTICVPHEDDDYEIPLQEETDMKAVSCAKGDYYDEIPYEDDPPQSCPQCQSALEVKPVSRMQPKMDEMGNPVMQPESRFKVLIEVGEPLYGFPRAGSKGTHDMDYFIWAERKSLDWIFWKMGYEANSDIEQADGYSLNMEHALNYFYTGYSNSTLNSKDSALVKMAFIEPRKVKKFPDGLYAVQVNGKIIKSGVWKDFFVDHPITYGGYMQIPTLFFARSASFDLVEVQREKQDYEALIKLHAMTAASSAVVLDENTVVDELTGRPDSVIKWRSIGPGSQAPHRMQAGNLDEGIYKMRQALHDEFENISGAVAVFRGRQPGSITAGTAISDLKGQAEQMFAKPVQNWNALWRETFRKAVKIAQSKFTAAQIAEIVGPDRDTAIMDFLKADIDTMLDYVASQGQPRTREERKQEMMMLFDRGALDINDPNVKQNIFELFENTGMMKIFNADATRARYENTEMQQGQPVSVMMGVEDMAVHLTIHTEIAKSLNFEKWPQPAKKILLQHILETQIAMKQLAAINAATEQPEPPGKGPAPKSKGAPNVKAQPTAG